MKLCECKNEKYDIIILAGQSNAEGCGLGKVENEFQSNELIHSLCDHASYTYKKYDDGRDYLDINYPSEMFIEVTKENLNDKGEKLGSLATSFALRYLKDGRLEKGRKILIIKAGVGGSGFYRPEWGVNNVLYNRLVDFTKTALSLNSENRVVAFLWHQGEHDTFEGGVLPPEVRYRKHYFNLRFQMETFYKTFSLSVPFVAGKFCEEWYSKETERKAPIVKAIEDVAFDLNGEIVETKDLLSNNQANNNEDEIHFSRQSQYILGERYYDAFVKCLNK